MKSGFVAILGRPNVGKSTIINKIVNQQVSIVTDKAQTTRNNIIGIYNDEDTQIVFLDTPGILPMNYENPKKAANLALIGAIREDILPNEQLGGL